MSQESVDLQAKSPAHQDLAGEEDLAFTAADSKPKLAGESSYGPDDLTCAICLDQIQLEDTAYVKGCEHAYCAKCILHWADFRDDSTCPQCKQPFSRLLTYRMLDGTLNDFPTEESVCLLKRATWVQEQLKAAEKGKAVASSQAFYSADPVESVTDWQDYTQYYDEYDDDEEVEDFYFSSAAGRARIVLGNRRWGENGYVASGRQQARPVQRTAKAAPGSSGKKGSAAKTSVVASTAAASKDQAVSSATAAGFEKPQADHEGAQAPAAHKAAQLETSKTAVESRGIPIKNSTTSPIAMPATPVAISGASKAAAACRRNSGCDVAGTSSDSYWGSSNSGSGWSAYEKGKKAAGKQAGIMGSSPGQDAGSNSKSGRRARRNAKKAAADAKGDMYAY